MKIKKKTSEQSTKLKLLDPTHLKFNKPKQLDLIKLWLSALVGVSLNLAETVRKFGLLCGKFAAPSTLYSYSEYSYSEYSYTAALFLNSPTNLPVCCVYTAHTHQPEV